MNLFVSLENILAPIGDQEAPQVGLLVEDWDENLMPTVGQFVDLGYSIHVIPLSSTSVESINPLTLIDEQPLEPASHPQVLFYYKGKPEDSQDEIPVLVAAEGKVQVSHEGRMKELAEYLGLLNDDRVRITDHEYRD